ncbi:unnamed protein product, partial [Amoebophrya sp. A25]
EDNNKKGSGRSGGSRSGRRNIIPEGERKDDPGDEDDADDSKNTRKNKPPSIYSTFKADEQAHEKAKRGRYIDQFDFKHAVEIRKRLGQKKRKRRKAADEIKESETAEETVALLLER